MIEALMNKLICILIGNTTSSWDHNIPFSLRVEFDNINLKIDRIVMSPVGWTPRKTFRIHKITILKRFRCNLLKTNITFKFT